MLKYDSIIYKGWIESNGDSSIFLTWLYAHLIQLPLIYHLLPNVRKASYTISASIFADVPYWLPYSTDKFISCIVLGPSKWFFPFGEEIIIAWTQEITTILWDTDPIILHDNAKEILEQPPYSNNMSLYVYNIFPKVKEPLRRTQYSKSDEPIHAIGRSIRNINKYGLSDGEQRLPNIWQQCDK